MGEEVPADQAAECRAASAGPPPLPASPTPVLLLERQRCDRCGVDVSRLPATAHFCPRCGRARDGSTVGEAVSASVKRQVDAECEVVNVSDISGQAARAVDWGQPPPLDSGPPTLPPFATVFEPLGPGERMHSVMLQGYASALHTLGNRYEVGRGVYRNEREAVRCYLKAARLGNEDAAERLADRGIATATQAE